MHSDESNLESFIKHILTERYTLVDYNLYSDTHRV